MYVVLGREKEYSNSNSPVKSINFELMSTLINPSEAAPIYSESDLQNYFQNHAKGRDCMRVGIEAEFFAVFRDTGQALPYEGPVSIHAILKGLAERYGYEAIHEGTAIIALKKAENMITLEPGGQIELSAPPVKTAFEVEEQLKAFIKEISGATDSLPAVRFLATGLQPVSSLEEISWVPKKRYRLMAEYLGKRGGLSHSMMKQTATNQVNLDYLDEEHAMCLLRTAFGITSIVSAMFCNSPFSEGRPNGYLSRRLEIWRHTDTDRTGILSRFLQPHAGFKDYLNYVFDMPMIFIVRDGDWIPMDGKPFRRFLKEGYNKRPATIADFELHLSTAFPEVRLKQYIEVRGIDGQRPALIPAVAAFWKGILYDGATREAAWDLVSFLTAEDRIKLAADVPRLGLQAAAGKYSAGDIAQELVDLACSSLGKQTVSPETRTECIYLNNLRAQIIRPRKTPAERLLEFSREDGSIDLQALMDFISLESVSESQP